MAADQPAPVPSKDEAVRTLQELDAELRRLLGALSDEQLAAPGTVGGGAWSAQDLMSHLQSWEELALDTLNDWRNRTPPRIHDRFRSAGGIDAMNEELALAKRAASPGEARRDAEQVHERLITEISSLGRDEWE
ncbi:MAG: maleylpyruvate isomerase N-terminal domain-containing protein, partial [Actinomycetota bacterium]